MLAPQDLHIRFPGPVADELRQVALERRWAVSELIRECCTQFLERERRPQPDQPKTGGK